MHDFLRLLHDSALEAAVVVPKLQAVSYRDRQRLLFLKTDQSSALLFVVFIAVQTGLLHILVYLCFAPKLHWTTIEMLLVPLSIIYNVYDRPDQGSACALKRSNATKDKPKEMPGSWPYEWRHGRRGC